MRSGLRVLSAFVVVLAVLGRASLAWAVLGPWQPAAGHTQIPLWPGEAPHARPLSGPEIAGTVVVRVPRGRSLV